MKLKLKDNRMVEVMGIVHFPTKYIVQDENKNEFQVFTHEVVRWEKPKLIKSSIK